MLTAREIFHDPTLTESAPFGVFTVGLDGRVRAWNEQAASLWGHAPAPRQDFRHGDFRCFAANGREIGAHESPFALALLRGLASEEQELIVEKPNGRRTTWLLRVEPVRDNARALLGAVAFFREKPATPRFLPLPGEEALPTLIGYVGTDLRYRFANAAFENWFGTNSKEVVGRTLAEVLGPAAFAEIAPEMRLALDGSNQEFERFIPTSLAGNRYLQLRLVPDAAPNGFVRGMAIIGNDVSATRRTELEALAKQARLGPAARAPEGSSYDPASPLDAFVSDGPSWRPTPGAPAAARPGSSSARTA